MEAENRAGSKDLKKVGDRVPRRSSRWSGSGSLQYPLPAKARSRLGVSSFTVLSRLVSSLSPSLFHQCGYHAKLSLFRSFPFPALLLLALHPEDRDLSREVDGHDNLWMMMMMMMWYTGFVTDRVPTPTLDNVSWQSLRTPHASEQRFKLLFDCCLTLGCA